MQRFNNLCLFSFPQHILRTRCIVFIKFSFPMKRFHLQIHKAHVLAPVRSKSSTCNWNKSLMCRTKFNAPSHCCGSQIRFQQSVRSDMPATTFFAWSNALLLTAPSICYSNTKPINKLHSHQTLHLHLPAESSSSLFSFLSLFSPLPLLSLLFVPVLVVLLVFLPNFKQTKINYFSPNLI